MNVYDQAHQLATAIKQSEEFKQFDDRKKKIAENPELESAMKDFMQKQFQMQTAQLTGQQMDQNLMMELQRLSAILMQDPTTAEYLQCQLRFSMMMTDVYKIIGEVSDIGMGSLADMVKM